MKNLIGLSAISTALLLCSCNKEKTIDQELKEAAATMNKLGPQVMSKGIRLDSTSAAGNKSFKYSYTLMEDVKESVTETEISHFKSEAKESAVNAVKTSPDMQIFRDNDITLTYVYYDKNGKLTADFSISPSEYKNK